MSNRRSKESDKEMKRKKMFNSVGRMGEAFEKRRGTLGWNIEGDYPFLFSGVLSTPFLKV